MRAHGRSAPLALGRLAPNRIVKHIGRPETVQRCGMRVQRPSVRIHVDLLRGARQRHGMPLARRGSAPAFRPQLEARDAVEAVHALAIHVESLTPQEQVKARVQAQAYSRRPLHRTPALLVQHNPFAGRWAAIAQE